ncbi:4Fe-4S dicluster domain-containing protein [Bacillus sp. 1NLA3E]|uniref:4Fe-4S dicluster domain-containing protein n=1 Tax=Bacillus sp. 1NLA3E TaxID=666686 RepID=UPI000247F11F|nr:4Fe-4S binding protein [Bacillus sp. 1NLA3E]
MSLIINWLESLSIDLHITERCSLEISPKSTCTACIDHCESEALSLQKNKIIIDSSKCHTCGKCIIACPISAISGTMPNRKVKNGLLFYEAHYCPSVKELLTYRKRGIREIAVPNGWQDDDWEKAVTEVNGILTEIGLSPFCFQQAEEIKDPGMTRRELFLSARTKGQSLAKEFAPASWRHNPKTWSLPDYYPDIQFYQVELDQEKCSLCKGCFSLCSQGALSLSESEFFIDNQKCTNCSICADACPEGAILIREALKVKSESRFPIFEATCKRCKQSYLSFADQSDDDAVSARLLDRHEIRPVSDDHVHNTGSGLCHVCSNMGNDWLMP